MFGIVDPVASTREEAELLKSNFLHESFTSCGTIFLNSGFACGVGVASVGTRPGITGECLGIVFQTGEEAEILETEDFIKIVSDLDTSLDSSVDSVANLFLMRISNITDDLVASGGSGADETGDIVEEVEVNELNLHFEVFLN